MRIPLSGANWVDFAFEPATVLQAEPSLDILKLK